jgi:beta propeller repeat protein
MKMLRPNFLKLTCVVFMAFFAQQIVSNPFKAEAAKIQHSAKKKDRPANASKAIYEPGVIIVKYNDNLQQDAADLFNNKIAFQTASKLNSSSLDVLNRELGVTKIVPLFNSALKSPVKARNLNNIKEDWQAKVRLNKQKLIFKGRHGIDFNKKAVDLSQIYILKVTVGKEDCDKYAKDPHVAYCQLNYVPIPSAFPNTLPNDTYVDADQNNSWDVGTWGQTYENMWNLKKIKANEAWPISQGNNVIVAVIDDGISYMHPDLSEDTNGNLILDPGEDQNGNGILDSNIWVNQDEIPNNGIDDDGNGFIDDVRGWNFTGSNNDIGSGTHGTNVAGVIAALGNNGRGIIGVAPKVKIMGVKMSSISQIVQAVNYAVSNGAQVINLSYDLSGGGGSNPLLEDALTLAMNDFDAVVVLPSGNYSAGAYDFDLRPEQNLNNYSPTNMTDPKPIVVGMTTQLDDRTSGWLTKTGSLMDVAAPGTAFSFNSIEYHTNPDYNIITTSMGRNYDVNSPYAYSFTSIPYGRVLGSSFSAAHVSGAVALIRSIHPEFTFNQIRQILRATADDVYLPGSDNYTGMGRINAKKALTVNSVPTVKIISPKYYQSISSNQRYLHIVGTAWWASGTNTYTLSYGMGSSPSTWNTIATSSIATQNSELAVLDRAAIPNGVLTLKLCITDALGLVFQDTISIFLENPPVELATSSVSSKFDVAGNHILWEKDGNLYICQYNSASKICSERTLRTGEGLIFHLAISKINDNLYHIVWETNDIYHCFYNPGVGTCVPMLVSSFASDHSNPKVSGMMITWEDDRNEDINPSNDNDDDDVDIYYCTSDMAGNCLEKDTNKTTELDEQYDPAIDGNFITYTVYTESASSDDEEIWQYDIGANSRKNLSSSGSAYQFNSKVSGSLKIWLDERNAPSHFQDIYIYNTSLKRVTSDQSLPISASISGNRVVWEDDRDGLHAVYSCLYNVSTFQCPEEVISINKFNNRLPKISGNYIVWLSNKSGSDHFYINELGSYTLNNPPAIGSLVDQATTVNTALGFNITASDPDTSDTVSVTALLENGNPISPLGATLTQIGNLWAFNWTPTSTQSGTYKIIFTASDGKDYVHKTVTVVVNPSPCFIATAAYGTGLEPQVQSLREYRDSTLLPSGSGKEFVSWYYRTSPPIADELRKHEGLRKAVRGALAPVVKFTQWYIRE